MRKILMSVFSPSSREPSPSVSMIMHFLIFPSKGIYTILGHIHNPLVQALMVGPTSNPLF